MALNKVLRRAKIKRRIRKKVTGTSLIPRLSVYRSNKQIYAQLIDDDHLVVTGRILETELRRVALRQGIEQAKATEVLAMLDVLEHDPPQFRQAGTVGGDQLRSLDALHLSSALRVGADAMITFDDRLERA
jgi:predicted nucleic acid-binding protein